MGETWRTSPLQPTGWRTPSTGCKRAHVGLVVLINKYDGIDLPDDACRVLVIEGLPGGLRRPRPAGAVASAIARP